MSLDIYLYKYKRASIFDSNITHNLNKMAEAAGIYGCVWRPEENGFENAGQLIEPLEKGIKELKSKPDFYKQFEPDNKWGTYDDFIPWLEEYLEACKNNPDAEIFASR